MGFHCVTMRHGYVRRALPALLAGAMLALAAGCSGGSPGPGGATAAPTNPQTGATRAASAMTWVVDRQALAELGGAGMSQNQLTELFDNSHTYLVGTSASGAESAYTGAWTTPRSATVTDLRAADFSRGEAAVLYDDEDWSLTPQAQQRDPGKYEAEGYRLARADGVEFIAAPALDLVHVLDPDGSGPLAQRFLNLDVIGEAARYADAVDIQAQSLEGTAQYASFVTAAARQARAANPDVTVLAGLSTNPSGRAVGSSVLAQDANAVRGVVDGYWLNIPSAGTACPQCGTADPQAAVPWLEQLLTG